MSYAGPVSARGATRRHARTVTPPAPDEGADWQQLALFGAGLAVGLALGAGIALLSAPQAGWKTRADIRRYSRNKRRAAMRRGRDAWQDLRDELSDAARGLARRRRSTARPRSPAEPRPDIDDR